MAEDRDIPDRFTYPTDPVTERREGVIEQREYAGPAITHLFWSVKTGDVLDITTDGTSTPNPRVLITEHKSDEPTGRAEDGTKYLLWPRYKPPNSLEQPRPWLRHDDGSSAGRINSVVVVEKAGSQ
jgi:hypothetical protein